jgi:hypothetical protein
MLTLPRLTDLNPVGGGETRSQTLSAECLAENLAGLGGKAVDRREMTIPRHWVA